VVTWLLRRTVRFRSYGADRRGAQTPFVPNLVPSIEWRSLEDHVAITQLGVFVAGDPMIADLFVRPFHCRPGDPMRGFLLSGVADASRERMIERFAVDVPRVFREVAADILREVRVGCVWHRGLPRQLVCSHRTS